MAPPPRSLSLYGVCHLRISHGNAAVSLCRALDGQRIANFVSHIRLLYRDFVCRTLVFFHAEIEYLRIASCSRDRETSVAFVFWKGEISCCSAICISGNGGFCNFFIVGVAQSQGCLLAFHGLAFLAFGKRMAYYCNVNSLSRTIDGTVSINVCVIILSACRATTVSVIDVLARHTVVITFLCVCYRSVICGDDALAVGVGNVGLVLVRVVPLLVFAVKQMKSRAGNGMPCYVVYHDIATFLLWHGLLYDTHVSDIQHTRVI